MNNKIFYGFLSFQMAIFLLVFELLSFYIFISIPSFENAKDISNHNVFRLTDNFLDEREAELYKNKIGYQLLAHFNKEISNSHYFKYYEIDSTSVYVPYTNNEIFIAGYENGNPQPSAKIKDDNGKDIKLSCIKAFHVSLNVFNNFNIKLESGRMLTPGDFVYKKGAIIPVLLGSSYKDFNKIGDLIDTYNAYGNFKCEVVGFLEKGSNITINQGYMHFLDRYMVLPSFEFKELPQTDKEKRSFIIKYLQKNGGIIKSPYDSKVVNGEISKIAKDVGLDDNSYVIIGQGFTNTLFKLTLEEIMVILSYFMVGMILFLVISLNALIKLFIERNLHFLGVHLMCGAGKIDLYKIILHKFLILSAISLILSLLLLKIVFNILSFKVLLMAAGVSIILLLVTVAYSYNKNITVDRLLRRKE